MAPTKSLASLIAVAALALTATPALAQHRGGGRSSGHATSGHAEAQHSARATPSRSFSGARVGGSFAPRAAAAAPSRSQSNARVIAPRSSRYVRVAPRILGSRVIGPRFSNPYYTFRPRFSVGLGLSVGYPVAFPYYGVDPYAYDPYYNPPAYAAPYSYAAPYLGGPDPGYASPGYASPGYASPGYTTPNSAAPAPNYGSSAPTAPGSLGVQPGAATGGGLSFDISPSGAEVFVDGRDMGPASNFAPTSEPLTLAPGRHHVELRATGRETMAFDSDVIAGQVIPYQGTMQAPGR